MERLVPGKKLSGIPAATWNQFVDTTKDVVQIQRRTNVRSSRGATTLRALLRNDTGADVTADFPVLLRGNPIITVAERESVVYEGVQYAGTTPLSTAAIDDIAIVQGPIPANEFRPAVMRGPSWVKVQWTDATHKFAKPAADNTRLVSATTGIKVLWHDTIPGTLPADLWALVWLGDGSAEKFRLIRGTCYGNVSAASTSFYIENVFPLAGGANPLNNPADSTEQIQVTNSQKEAFTNGEYVTAIWFENGFGSGWQTLPVERFRSIRGTWYSGTSTLLIKNVVTLESGIDPRSNPADTNEVVQVTNVPGDTYATGDAVYADWSVVNQRWESRPKGGDRFVAAGPDDPSPKTLIEKLYNNGTYNSSTDTLVKFQEIDDSGTKKVQGFVTSGGGGGGLAAGCGIDIAGGVISVDYDDLVGTGLEVDTDGPGPCSDSLRVKVIEVGKAYNSIPAVTENNVGAGGGGTTVLPGTGLVKPYRQTTDPSRYDNFDPPEAVKNWFPRTFVDGEPVLILRTKEDDQFVVPVTDFPVIYVKNSSGVLPNRAIVWPGDPLYPPLGQTPTTRSLATQPTFYSNKPRTDRIFAITLAGALLNDIVPAVTVGPVAVQVYVSDPNHKYADVIQDDYFKLKSARTGPAVIMWREKQNLPAAQSIGQQWAIVHITQTARNSEDVRGVTKDRIAAASGSMSGPIRPGIGPVQLYNMPTDGGYAGEEWPLNTDDPIMVENWMFQEIPAFKPVLMRPSRIDANGTYVYVIHAQGCNSVPEI